MFGFLAIKVFEIMVNTVIISLVLVLRMLLVVFGPFHMIREKRRTGLVKFSKVMGYYRFGAFNV